MPGVLLGARAGTSAAWRGNEPGGMSLIGTRQYNLITELDGVVESPFHDHLDLSKASVISDSSAPRSPNNVLQALLPLGEGSGASPVGTSWLYWGATPKRTIYACWWSKYSSNFWGQGSGVNKVTYNYTPAFNGLFYSIAYGVGLGNLQPYIGFQGTVSQGTVNFGPNVAGATGTTIPRNQWNLWEILQVGNTAGNTDGSIDLWLNGVHCISLPMQWEAGGTNWGYWYYYPDWGGGAGEPIPYDMWIWWDEVYVSGKN